MATPEPWENATPIFGIRYPKPNAPAVKLPDAFGHLGGDVEAALQAASIPPVISAAVMVAPTAAARDDYWGVPTDPAAQLTLQNRGATTIRTDTGWTEQYFATATPPGWYPISGAMPLGQNLTTASTSIPTATFTIISGTALVLQNITRTGAAFVVPITGLYRLDVFATFGGNATGQRIAAAFINGAQGPGGGMPGAAASISSPAYSAVVSLAAGQTVDGRAYQSSGIALAMTPNPTYPSGIRLEWVGPVR